MECLKSLHNLLRLSIIACMCSLLAWPALATGYGLMRGKLHLRDGPGCAGIPVTVTCGEVTYTFTSALDGTFAGVVTAGALHVQAGATTIPVTVAPGTAADFDMPIDLPGVLVSVPTSSETASVYSVYAAYRSPAGSIPGLYGTQVAPGWFWIAGVPAEATALAVLLSQFQGDQYFTVRQNWHFTTASASRRVTMNTAPLLPLRFTVVNEQGTPVRDAQVWGSVQSNMVVSSYWEDEDALYTPQQGEINVLHALRTDADGEVLLGYFPARSYDLLLGAGESVGGHLVFTLKDDGTTSTDHYAVTRPVRPTVRQTVFDARHKPAANADVSASYCWQGRVTLRNATSDDTGQVTWTDLPPVRVIVWGDRVPACVLPDAASTLNDPLPAPALSGGKAFRFYSTVAADLPTYFSWELKGNKTPWVRQSLRVLRTGVTCEGVWSCACYTGEEITLRVEARTTPPRGASLKGLILPYLDIERTAADFIIELTTTNAPAEDAAPDETQDPAPD